MAQHDYIISNATFPAVRTDINNALSAIQTTNSGTSRPTGAVAGQLWLDTTSATTPTLKYYDGADDISLATIDHVGNTVNWLDSTVSITGLSTTATGTVLTLSDSVNTTTVNLIIDNQKEIRFRETTANGTNYVALKAPASVASDLTFTLPATDGTNGQAIITNGSGVLSFTTLSADGTADWDTTVKTANFTATANKGYFCNTTSGEITVTLPSSPSAGDEVIIVDYAGTFATNNLIITATPKINGSTNDVSLTTNREATRLVYIDSTQGYVAYSGVNEGTSPSLTNVPPSYSVDYLVVAGGGAGGGGYQSGGGGAGGMLTGTSSFVTGTVYTTTVGAGGTGNAAGTGNSGSDSSISGTGLSTITSTGGGGGRYYQQELAGVSGGSGGGAGANAVVVAGGAGTAGQGNNGGGGNQSGNSAPYIAGGGGGKGAVGEGGTTISDGDGGDGSASSITGSSVTYAGGGGGSLYSSGYSTYGEGGTGGGGNGGRDQDSYAGTAGTANTGGGGGGAIGASTAGNAGGSGVVILRIPASSYSGTTTGSPTVTDDGSFKVVKFTGSGSYTA